MSSSATSESCETPGLNASAINGQYLMEKNQMNGQNNLAIGHSDQKAIKEAPPPRKEDYSSDMGIFNSKNGPTFDGTPINLLDERSFVMNDKMKNSLRDFMNKMSENTPTLGNLLAKTKYTGLNSKDTRSVINMNATPSPTTSTTTTTPTVSGGAKAASIGNLFDKMQEMQNSTTSDEKTTEKNNKGNAAASVESVTNKNCNEVIELDDSIEDKEIEKNNCDLSVQSNDLKDKCNQKKSEDELLEISSDSDNEVKQKLQKEERKENDMKPEEEDKLLASDEDDTRQSGVSTASHHSQETIAKCEDSQESMNKCEDSQESIGKFEDSGESISKFEDSPESTSKFEDSRESTSKCEDSRESTSKCEDSRDSADCEKGSDSNNGKDNESASEKMEVDEEEEESDSESVKNEDSDSKSSEDSKKSDSGDKKVEKGINEKKRPANFEDALAFGPKRTRLDMVIGKLGSQIGIAPESLKDEEMSDTDTATESTPTPTEDTEDEDEENSLQRKKKKPPVRLSEKALDKMVKTKVLNHLKTQKDGIVAELQQKVEELQASNDGWKQRVKELEKQILEVTVLQQKHEKRKAKTAALRQITTKNVGVQVDSQRAAAAIGQLQQQQVQQTTPVKSPTPRPASRTPSTTTVQTPPTTKQGPVLNITKSTSASPQLVPPRSTLNPVPNIPILKTQTTAQSQTGYVSQTAPVVALATSPANTADNSKGPFPSNQTVKSILDNSRGQIAQPTGNSRVRPVRAMTPATQINTIISPPTIPNQMTSFIVVPTPAPIPNTKQNVSVVTTPVVNQPIQQAQQSQQVQTKSVKVIDLTMEEEANRNLANRGVALSMSQNQVLVPTGQGLPQGLILGNPATSILRNGQQPAYQIVFSSTSQPVRLTYAAPIPNTSMRPAVAGTTVVASTSQTIAAMPQLRPGQAVGSPANPRQPLPVTSAQQRPPPPLQYGAQGANRVANTSLTTVAPPPLAPQHPAPLPSITSAVAPGQKPLPPKPSLKISRVSQGIVLSWNMTLNETPHADIASYQLFAYQEGTSTPSTTLWKKVGDVKALPLPMACTLTQFQEGNKYHFAVRPVDVLGRNGHFSDPSSIHLLPNKKD